MAKLSLPNAQTIKNETIPGANTALRVGSLFENIVNFINLNQVADDIITPPILTVTTNDYNPAGFATANMIRQDIDANNREISGFVAPAAGVNRIIMINNISTFNIRFLHNDAGSLAANRLLLGGNSNQLLQANRTGLFWYDHISQRWRALRVG